MGHIVLLTPVKNLLYPQNKDHANLLWLQMVHLKVAKNLKLMKFFVSSPYWSQQLPFVTEVCFSM